MAIVQDLGRVAAVVEHHVRGPAAGTAQGLVDAPFVFSSLSPFQAKTGMSRAAIAAAAWSWVEKMLHELQRTVAPSWTTGLDQHRGLDRHVQAADDLRARERPGRAELLAQGHQPRHLGLGDRDLAPPQSASEMSATLLLRAGIKALPGRTDTIGYSYSTPDARWEGRERHAEILGEATRLVEAAKIVPELDHRHFTLEAVCNAYRAIKTGPVTGKIVLDVDLLALIGE